MYDEKEEQGLVKSKDVFNNILNKEDKPLEKALPSVLARSLPAIAKFGKSALTKLFTKPGAKEGTRVLSIKRPLIATGLAGGGTYYGMEIFGDDKEAAAEYNSITDPNVKKEVDNYLQESALKAIDNMSESQKKEAADLFDNTFRGLSAAQIADIGQADRDAIAPPSEFKDVGYVKPIFDTNPEYDRQVKEQGAPEMVVGYETQAGSTMFNKPMTRTQFGTGAQFAKSFLKKQPTSLTNLFGGASTGSTGTKPLEVATTGAAGQPTSFKTPTGTIGTRDENDPLFSVDPTGTKGSDVGGTIDMEGFEPPGSPDDPETPAPPDLDFGTSGVTAGGMSYREYQESLTPEFGTEAPTIQAQPGEAEFFDQFQNAIIKEAVSEFMEKAKKKKGGRKKDPRLARAGVEGFNKPKRTPKHPTKSHIVVAKEGKKIKTIRYGQQGAKTAGDPKKGESEKMKKKRKSFKARHRKNIKRGKMSAAYWADKSKW